MMIRDFRRRFFVSLVLSVPVILLSPTVQSIFNFELTVPGRVYVSSLLSALIFFYGGWPFLTGLVDELKKKEPGMMTLIALALSVAFGYSLAVALGLPGRLFYWELATLVDVMLLGHWIEMRSLLGASKALEELARLVPDKARRIRGETAEEVPISELGTGDRVLVRPGEKVPVDGDIVKGYSALNESMLTGESEPVDKETGERVLAGSVNGDGTLEIEITGAGEESYLSRVVDLVREAQGSSSRTQRLADRAALWLTIISISVGSLTLLAWLLVGREAAFAIERMATVMIITCPHALGLAIPLVVSVSTSRAARSGLLIRDRAAFEGSRNITTVLFDKTGTLTEGRFTLVDVRSLDDTWSRDDLLAAAAALEQGSEHPLARGILEGAEREKVTIPRADDIQTLRGRGIQGRVHGEEVTLAGDNYLRSEGMEEPGRDGPEEGTSLYLITGSRVRGRFLLRDVLREESVTAVRELKRKGISCWMITGDSEGAAAMVADQLDLEGYFSGILPDEKEKKVRELQEEGHVVAMAGDGINDAPALARADIGIAVGSGTDVAAETADIILVNSNPMDVTRLILFGKATYRKMIQNLVWATAYNVVAIPLAAGVLFWAGILISPAVGALLMSASTVIVAVNARFLNTKTEEED
jgi:Cu2+-exporting ATPase